MAAEGPGGTARGSGAPQSHRARTAPHSAPTRPPTGPIASHSQGGCNRPQRSTRSHLPAPAGTPHRTASGPFWDISSEGECPRSPGTPSRPPAAGALCAPSPSRPRSPRPLSAAVELRAKAPAEPRPRRSARARGGRRRGPAMAAPGPAEAAAAPPRRRKRKRP
ncbi:uncharacterized protein LOC135305517 [Passer domesticus]|uniref:uncharacterized protein LOC135305517 n=1 Tax=Passer domesticus TaxID=48849 RepID=UPI0030FED117